MNEELDLSKLEFSRNDFKRGIKTPKELTPELSYFLGFHIGDGYMSIQKREGKIDYRMAYHGHGINEFLGYEQVIKPLIRQLFNKEVNLTQPGDGTVNIFFRSKAILTFLHFCCGVQLSPKKGVDVPSIIKNASLQNKARFLRGLADTDFSLVFKRGTYPVIEHTTCSQPLHQSLKLMLEKLGLSHHACVRHRLRKDTPIVGYQLEICGQKNLQMWMNYVGFSSYNTLTRYLVWKETGFLPAKTNIHDRIKILKMRGIKFPPTAPGRI